MEQRALRYAIVAGLVGGLSGLMVSLGAQSWTTPRTWASGEVVGAGQLNTHVRDNLSYLYNALTTLDASDTISGVFDAARLGSGTASASNYLRGDQTWGGLNAAHLTGTVPVARLPNNVSVDTRFDTDSTSTSSATTTWVDTGLSLTITVDDATNDVVLMAWQHVSASGGNAGCQLRLVRGTPALTTHVTGVMTDEFMAMLAHEDANPGTGARTYKTQLNRTGTSNTCYTEQGSTQSVLWASEVQD